MCLAIPGKIEQILDNRPLQRTGRVNFGGIFKEVNLSCVPEAACGDYVLVHVGLAISKVDPLEAARVFKYLEEMDELRDINEGSSL